MAILNLVLISGIAGFAAYCASYAIHVWRSRNASARSNFSARAQRGAALAMLIGAVLLVVAYGLSLAESREGLLVGHDLITVRLPKEMQLSELASGPKIRSGQVLARFSSPQLEGEAADLRFKRQILQAERRIVLGQPVLPEPQLESRFAESEIERRHLQASRDQLLPAQDLIERESAKLAAENAQKMAQLDADLNLAKTWTWRRPVRNWPTFY